MPNDIQRQQPATTYVPATKDDTFMLTLWYAGLALGGLALAVSLYNLYRYYKNRP